ncbi:MAG: tRNA (N6-threonylcarbamoyladenosine(37)-N6)-methyltransferase TrmO [Deltaproteobacteria bacterium]|nr:tRNA (N6-threonylcarbamoyladenosine(37)-N6)-methyltransferase TrmO [Deltaproteobacteria bacterium]
MGNKFEIYQIGTVEKQGGETIIKICKKYKEALLGLDGFSHMIVCYWFHKNDTPEQRRILQVYPKGHRYNPLTGVFATCSPVRPNLLAISICKILSIEDTTIRIDDIDALDQTPVIDIKPYVPHMHSKTDHIKVPEWIMPK